MELEIIHVVLGKANPNRMNGVNKVVNSLAAHQVSLGHTVSVWGITKNPVHDYPTRDYNTRLFKDVSKFRLDSSLAKALKTMDPEKVVFHLHGGFIPQFHMLARKLVARGFRYVLTPHGAYNMIAMQRSWLKKRIYVRSFEWFLVQNAHAIHLIGDSEVAGTQAVFGDVPYRVIPNGHEVTDQFFVAPSRGEAPVFGFVGRLDAHTKGLDLLLNAFAEYRVRLGSPGELWLVGDGEDMDHLKYMAECLSISNHVKFLGAKYGDEKMDLIQSMDYLCLNSRNEGLPGVVLEAAAQGVPVIVSEETNMGAYVRDNNAGFVTERNDVPHILKALLTAAARKYDHTRLLMSINASEMVKKHFDWRSIAAQHSEVYEN